MMAYMIKLKHVLGWTSAQTGTIIYRSVIHLFWFLNLKYHSKTYTVKVR